MAHRRRRTDRLASADILPVDALERVRTACAALESVGIESALALQVPFDNSSSLVCAVAGRAQHALDIARGLARHAVATARPLAMIDSTERIGLRRWRHAAIPIGATRSGTIVLVVSDPNLSRREAQAIAAWASSPEPGSLRVEGGPCSDLAHGIAREFGADAVVLALFASAGMHVNVHVRSGGLLQTNRVPGDTVWGEVARHAAAYTLGDLEIHPGCELLASLGMRTAALVGLENGNGIAIGALGIASAGDLDVDISHHLLERAPLLGPDIMHRMSSTAVPVPQDDGSVDVGLLAARVGCERFAMYRVEDGDLELVAAHTPDGSIHSAPPETHELQLVAYALDQGVGVMNQNAAAVVIGEHTVLYAQDSERRALDCLRRALHDVHRNPFAAEAADGDGEADAA